MADKKISALPAATTPLAGTEVLPIVQGGTTDQVSVANITAGRAVSGASFDVTGSTPPTNGVYLPSANLFGVATNGSLKLNVDASGNVGVNTTPPAHGSAERSIDVGNTVSFGRGSSAELNVNFNTFLNQSGQYIYRISSFASSYQQLAGEHKFFTAPSGTAGNVATLTQRVTITQPGDLTLNTGNVVVGTAGKGIDFSANTHATGMTKEVLDWYEEGTYTPTVASASGTITSYTGTSWYTRIGRQVTVVANVVITNAGTGAGVCTISLPFTNNATVSANGVGRENAISGALLQGSVSIGGTVVNVLKFDNSTAIATNAQIRITITYFV